MKVVNWNFQWAAPGSVRSPEILHRTWRRHPDIVCLTETECERRCPYPPLSQPVRAQLQEAMPAAHPPGLTIATAGLGLRGRRAIDHIAISGHLSARFLTAIDNMDGDRRLSERFSVVADLSVRDAQQNPR